MDRVFLDANVLFSAAYREKSGLRSLWLMPEVRLVTSTYAFAEASRNLQTAEQTQRLDQLAEQLELVAEPATRPAVPGAVDLPDGDLPILQAAMASNCSHLLSGDRRAFGSYYREHIAGILILRPADYLSRRPR